MKTQFIILVSLLIGFTSCTKERSEITDRWETGAKKTVLTFQGEGNNENLINTKHYNSSGEILLEIKHVESDTILFPSMRPDSNELPIGGYKVVKLEVDSSGTIIQSLTKEDFVQFRTEITQRKIISTFKRDSSFESNNEKILIKKDSSLIAIPKKSWTPDYKIFDYSYGFNGANIVGIDNTTDYKRSVDLDKIIELYGAKLTFTTSNDTIIYKSTNYPYTDIVYLVSED